MSERTSGAGAVGGRRAGAARAPAVVHLRLRHVQQQRQDQDGQRHRPGPQAADERLPVPVTPGRGRGDGTVRPCPHRRVERQPALAGEVNLRPGVLVQGAQVVRLPVLLARREPRHQAGGEAGGPAKHRHGRGEQVAVAQARVRQELVHAVGVPGDGRRGQGVDAAVGDPGPDRQRLVNRRPPLRRQPAQRLRDRGPKKRRHRRRDAACLAARAVPVEAAVLAAQVRRLRMAAG